MALPKLAIIQGVLLMGNSDPCLNISQLTSAHVDKSPRVSLLPEILQSRLETNICRYKCDFSSEKKNTLIYVASLVRGLSKYVIHTKTHGVKSKASSVYPKSQS